jgi:hypothetical protein
VKKAESFVQNAATVFIALSVVMGFGYFVCGLITWSRNFDDVFPTNKSNLLDPLTFFILGHLKYIVASGFAFEIIVFAASIGLLSHQNWARKTFLPLFAFQAVKNISFFIFVFYQISVPRSEVFYKILYHGPVFYWVVFVFNLLWRSASAGLYVWLLRRFTEKDVRAVFK